MSLIGIDVGSSAIKVVAYDGRRGFPLAGATESTAPSHPNLGLWEANPEWVWKATKECLRRVIADPSVVRNPPEVMSISASGREAFPVGRAGNALGPCIMTGDMRASGMEDSIAAEASADFWLRECGHLPERMDPVFRLFWWRRNHPDVMAKAKYFFGWHEFLTLRFTGRSVTDRSLASKWLVYNLDRQEWSDELISRYGIDFDLLPEVQPWGTIIGPLRAELVSEIGAKEEIQVAVGGFDALCSSLGAGVLKVGSGCLLSGTWEDIVVPVISPLVGEEFAKSGFSIGPYPGEAGMAIFGLSPNGASALNWLVDLFGISLDDLNERLKATDLQPSSVLAIAHLSGATIPWGEARSRGTLLGMTLATSTIEIIKSFLESISFDLVFTMNKLKEIGFPLTTFRGAGGGIRLEWWTRLKCDLTNIPIEIVNQQETGTVGAASLAGLATGRFKDLEDALMELVRVKQRIEPDVGRFAMDAQYTLLLTRRFSYDDKCSKESSE